MGLTFRTMGSLEGQSARHWASRATGVLDLPILICVVLDCVCREPFVSTISCT